MLLFLIIIIVNKNSTSLFTNAKIMLNSATYLHKYYKISEYLIVLP